MRKLFVVFALLGLMVFASCSTSKKLDVTNKTSVCLGKKVKFELVNNYFFRNDAKIPVSPLITSQTQFDSLFGAAAFMGKDGEPTKVDFSKQSIIAVVKPSSTVSMTLSPSCVYKDGEHVTFIYSNITGNEQTYFSQPILLIAVDKSDVDGCDVSVHEERDVSASTLIISYDSEIGDSALMQAVKDTKAKLIYHYNIINGIAIRIPQNMTMPEAIKYFKKVKGVIAVERDHVAHLN